MVQQLGDVTGVSCRSWVTLITPITTRDRSDLIYASAACRLSDIVTVPQ